jgi:excisionase family DNA binding protein
MPARKAPNVPPTLSVWSRDSREPTAAKLLGIGRLLAYRHTSDGKIPCLRIGTKKLVPTAPLREMLGMSVEEFAAALDTIRREGR